MTIEQYAKKILDDAGCNLHTYGGDQAKHIMDDLKQAFPDGMPEYTYIEVANAILAMSTPEPIKRDPFILVWDTDSCCDSYGAESLEAAKNDALDTLLNWMVEESWNWSFLPDGTPNPTEEQKNSWDYMIYNCWVEVRQYNPKTDDYETVWEPSDGDLTELGWKTFADE